MDNKLSADLRRVIKPKHSRSFLWRSFPPLISILESFGVPPLSLLFLFPSNAYMVGGNWWRRIGGSACFWDGNKGCFGWFVGKRIAGWVTLAPLCKSILSKAAHLGFGSDLKHLPGKLVVRIPLRPF